MADKAYKYVIVGGGRAGASAVKGIRDIDPEGSILMLGGERFLPYDRPPSSKKLWFGQKKLEDVFIHDDQWYLRKGADLLLGKTVVGVEPRGKTVTESGGATYRYEKLLLATGGVPRILDIPGGDLAEICYYRNLDDYIRLRVDSGEGKTALVIGGGFVGSEIAAALTHVGAALEMVFPEGYLCQRVFPADLGKALTDGYVERGIEVWAGDVPVSIEKSGGKFVTRTKNGKQIESDIVVVGAGILPSTTLAEQAGLEINDGIVVDGYCRTSDPDIFAAGDNANFPYPILGGRRRIEHWDHALNHGKHAGMNMAGAEKPYDYMPYFWCDLFEFGYEALGEVDSRLDTFADWEKEFDTGVVYYLRDGRVRGAMTCNIYDKQEAVRDLIKSGRQFEPNELKGIIKS